MQRSARVLGVSLLCTVVLLVSLAPLMSGFSGGIGGQRVANGCTCHGEGGADPSVSPLLLGVPQTYEAGMSYNLTVQIQGGPVPGGEHQGGFNLDASDGALLTRDDTTQRQEGQLTHTTAGNGQRTWQVAWMAPKEEDHIVTFRLLVNSVDGDFAPSSTDSWNRATFTSRGPGAGGIPQPQGGTHTPLLQRWFPLPLVVVLSLVLAVLIVLLLLPPAAVRGPLGRFLLHWLTTTNHKDIGVLYFVTSLLMYLVGGALAMVMRGQLAGPSGDLVSPQLYNQLVTMHGAIMALFFLSPLGFAFANYLVPLQIGARDLAFPRINALSYWLYLLGALVAASGFFVGGAADVGWTFYAPLTNATYSPGLGVDLAGIGLFLLFLSVTISTINFLVTILRLRAPTMGLWQVPMFTWSVLMTVLIMLIIFPALGGALLLLVSDRHFGTHFFDSALNGALLWDHLFWFFGHPEVYVLLLPSLGTTAEILQAFSRRPLYGRRYIMGAMVVGVVLSVIVWGHHMFTTGIDQRFLEVQVVLTESISIPFAVIVLCYILTLHGGKLRLRTPALWALGSLALFTIGGITGVFLASQALDTHLRGSYYVVAHFHYTLVGSTTFALIGGIYYWFPKMSGRMLSERLGRWHFGISFLSFNLNFLPLFELTDMPRRIATYDVARWVPYNQVATVGAIIFGVAQLLLIVNLLQSMRRGAPAGKDPWRGPSLEWTLSSPPPHDPSEQPPVVVAAPATQAVTTGSSSDPAVGTAKG